MISIFERFSDEKKELFLMLMRSYMEGIEAGSGLMGNAEPVVFVDKVVG